MSDKVDQKDKIGASAEKAYAAAADAAVAAVTPEAAPVAAPVVAKPAEKVADKAENKAADKPMALPALKPAKRAAAAPVQAAAKPAPAPAKVAPKAAAPAATPAPAAIKAAKPAPVARRSYVKRAAQAPAVKPSSSTPALAVKAGPASAEPVRASFASRNTPSAAATPKPAKVTAPQMRAAVFAPKLSKETLMDMTNTFTDGFKTVVTDAQDKAKAAYAKSTEAFGDYAEFAKGNVEAIVESGKILATGLQGLGTDLVADTKQSVETLTADVKQLAAAKSPSELVKLQGDLVRRNFDSAVAYNTKAGEAMLKLANEFFVPISGRFSLAMDKLGKAA
jgi:phasin family protein